MARPFGDEGADVSGREAAVDLSPTGAKHVIPLLRAVPEARPTRQTGQSVATCEDVGSEGSC